MENASTGMEDTNGEGIAGSSTGISPFSFTSVCSPSRTKPRKSSLPHTHPRMQDHLAAVAQHILSTWSDDHSTLQLSFQSTASSLPLSLSITPSTPPPPASSSLVNPRIPPSLTLRPLLPRYSRADWHPHHPSVPTSAPSISYYSGPYTVEHPQETSVATHPPPLLQSPPHSPSPSLPLITDTCMEDPTLPISSPPTGVLAAVAVASVTYATGVVRSAAVSGMGALALTAEGGSLSATPGRAASDTSPMEVEGHHGDVPLPSSIPNKPSLRIQEELLQCRPAPMVVSFLQGVATAFAFLGMYPTWTAKSAPHSPIAPTLMTPFRQGGGAT